MVSLFPYKLASAIPPSRPKTTFCENDSSQKKNISPKNKIIFFIAALNYVKYYFSLLGEVSRASHCIGQLRPLNIFLIPITNRDPKILFYFLGSLNPIFFRGFAFFGSGLSSKNSITSFMFSIFLPNFSSSSSMRFPKP